MDKYEKWAHISAFAILIALIAFIGYTFTKVFDKSGGCEYTWEDTGFRVEVERLSDEEANAYYDGRKLVNDNQRNYIDNLAEGDK